MKKNEKIGELLKKELNYSILQEIRMKIMKSGKLEQVK